MNSLILIVCFTILHLTLAKVDMIGYCKFVNGNSGPATIKFLPEAGYDNYKNNHPGYDAIVYLADDPNEVCPSCQFTPPPSCHANCPIGFEWNSQSLICTDKNECYPSSPCENGGTCTNQPGDYDCNCIDTGYTGKNCNIDIDECDPSSPCLNGGTCTNQPGDYSCDCTDTDFKGSNCETYREDCVDFYPCVEGGIIWNAPYYSTDPNVVIACIGDCFVLDCTQFIDSWEYDPNFPNPLIMDAVDIEDGSPGIIIPCFPPHDESSIDCEDYNPCYSSYFPFATSYYLPSASSDPTKYIFCQDFGCTPQTCPEDTEFQIDGIYTNTPCA